MAIEETTQWPEGWESNDALNSYVNESQHSPQEFRNSSQPGGAASPETTDFVLVIRCLVVAVGVIGFFMNGFVLRAVLSKKLKKNTSHTFLTNQVIMDTLSSFLLIVTYAFKIAAANYYYEGPSGYAVCILLYSDVLVFTVQVGSIASLVLIAAERYFKIVLPVLHKRFYKDWMTVVAITFSWINGILMNIAILFTSGVVDGNCLTFYFYPTPEAGNIFVLFLVTWQFIIPLFLFTWFYGSILIVIRKRNRVIHGNHSNEDTSAKRSQMIIVITMFTVSLSFVVSWFPNQLFVVLTTTHAIQDSNTVYNSTMFLIFLNTCVNPLIYASKHEHVRKNLKSMFLKNRSKENTNTTQVVSTMN